MYKNYRLSFDPWCLLLFLLIMVPNLIWFIIPAPNDLLRISSTVKLIDTIATVFQIIMLLSLCFFKNTKAKSFRLSLLLGLTIISCLLYFICWVLYYNSRINSVIILGLAILPCLSFFLFAIDRKNWLALIPILIFTICHIASSLINFII